MIFSLQNIISTVGYTNRKQEDSVVKVFFNLNNLFFLLRQHGPTENDRKMSKTAIDLTENNAFYTKHTTPLPATTPAPTASNKVLINSFLPNEILGL